MSATGCTRSHPHELMPLECELRTEIARLTNELTRLQRHTRQLADSERESIAQYFNRQSGREFFGTEVADLIREKRDGRDCGNCAHNEVRSQDEPCSQCIDSYNSSDLEFVHWKERS